MININNVTELLKNQFAFEPKYQFNDISFDKSITVHLFNLFEKIKFENDAKYEAIKKLISRFENDIETVLFLRAHIAYIDGDFESAANYFLQMIERCPTNIDLWAYLTFALMKTKHYELSWSVVFNTYHFMHFYQKYNFHTLNIGTLTTLKKIINSAEPENTYLWAPKFEEEFLIISRQCNNNCITCPNESILKNSTILPFLDNAGMRLSEYLFFKIGKKHIKSLVFTGGEPTILENFFDVLNAVFMTRHDINLIIQTNGRMFCSGAFLAKFEKYKTKKICFEVSLFSDKKDIHNQITQCKDSFEQTTQGIINLLEKGHSVEINILLNPLNYREVHRSVDFVATTFGKYRTLNKLNFITPVLSGNYANSFDYCETKKMLDFVDEYIKNYTGDMLLELKNRYL